MMAYETTTEGTPMSPSFPTSDEGCLALIGYCAEHCATWGDNRADAETWAAILFSEDLAAFGQNRSITFT